MGMCTVISTAEPSAILGIFVLERMRKLLGFAMFGGDEVGCSWFLEWVGEDVEEGKDEE